MQALSSYTPLNIPSYFHFLVNDWCSKMNVMCNSRVLRDLVEGFIKTNYSSRFLSFDECTRLVTQRLALAECTCVGSHSAAMRNCWLTPPSLLTVLVKFLGLTVDGMVDCLHRHSYLPHWHSPF